MAGDFLLLGACNGIFRALERSTGRVRWETRVGSSPDRYFFHGDPVVTDDTIIIGADSATGGGIHAFDRVTGRQRWTIPVGFGVNGPIAGSGQRVFASAPVQSELLGIEIDSGKVLWRVTAKMPGFEGPGAMGDRVFAGTADGWLHAFDAQTGREQWKTSLGSAVTTSVSAFQKGVYAGTADGTMLRVDPENGTILARLKIDETLNPRSVPVRADDSLLVLLANASADYLTLVSLDLTLDKLRWRQAAEQRWNTSRVFIWNSTAIVGTSSGEIVGYCTADGRKAWSHTVRGSVRSIGGAADLLYVTTQGGSLYAIEPPVVCSTR